MDRAAMINMADMVDAVQQNQVNVSNAAQSFGDMLDKVTAEEKKDMDFYNDRISHEDSDHARIDEQKVSSDQTVYGSIQQQLNGAVSARTSTESTLGSGNEALLKEMQSATSVISTVTNLLGSASGG